MIFILFQTLFIKFIQSFGENVNNLVLLVDHD